MQIRRVLQDADHEEAHYRPYLNSGGMVDIINGKMITSSEGGYAVSGGLGLTTAYIATANKFKSTLMNSTNVSVLARWPGAQLFNYDSEYAAIDRSRLANMSDLYLDEPEKRAKHIAELEENITIFDPTNDVGESLDSFVDFIKEIRDDKIKHAKDYTVETEVLDPKTGKPYLMLFPTLAGIDSWTEAMVKQLNIRNDEFTADTEMSKQRTIFLEEGLKKATLMRQLPSICAKGGIYLSMTGHLGKKFSIDGKPVAKDLQFMGQDETAKAMGPKFLFLMSSIFKIAATAPLVDKNDRRLSDYPTPDGISGSELLRLALVLVRSKNAPSGLQGSTVASQGSGILQGLGFYDFLRENKYYGLGSPNKVRSPLLGEKNLGRTKIFSESMNYTTRRALELTAQLFYIQNNWSLLNSKVNMNIPIEEFAEKLLANKSISTDDVLNTRGWWTYRGAPVERNLLSIIDAVAIVTDQYTPKLFAVTDKK